MKDLFRDYYPKNTIMSPNYFQVSIFYFLMMFFATSFATLILCSRSPFT